MGLRRQTAGPSPAWRTRQPREEPRQERPRVSGRWSVWIRGVGGTGEKKKRAESGLEGEGSKGRRSQGGADGAEAEVVGDEDDFSGDGVQKLPGEVRPIPRWLPGEERRDEMVGARRKT